MEKNPTTGIKTNQATITEQKKRMKGNKQIQ